MHTKNTPKHVCVDCGKHVSAAHVARCRACWKIHAHNVANEPPAPGSKTERTCKKCGATFHARWPAERRVYCSRKCSDKAQRVPPAKFITKTCPYCGKSFQQEDWKRRNVECCSRTCAKRYQALTVVGENHHLYKPKTPMECETCGRVCMVKPSLVSRFRFCSNRCKGTYSAHNQSRVSSLETTMGELFSDADLGAIPQHPIGQYIVDFAFPDHRLIVECDGSYWHSLPGMAAKDRRRDGYMKHLGWRVLRLPEDDIRRDARECLERVIHAIGPQAHRVYSERKSQSPTSGYAYVQRSLIE